MSVCVCMLERGRVCVCVCVCVPILSSADVLLGRWLISPAESVCVSLFSCARLCEAVFAMVCVFKCVRGEVLVVTSAVSSTGCIAISIPVAFQIFDSF